MVRAIVADVAYAIPGEQATQVVVRLIGVGDGGAVVHIAAHAVAIGVVLRVVGASVADITNAIAIGIRLTRQVRVCDVRAVVADVAPAIAIGILLARVWGDPAVVHIAAHAVAIDVVVRVVGAVVADVAHAIPVGIRVHSPHEAGPDETMVTDVLRLLPGILSFW